MYAFGHGSAGYLLMLLLPIATHNLTFIIPVLFLSILPDIDLLFKIKHRTITHSIYSIIPFILIGLAIFTFLGYFTGIFINITVLIVFLFLLWLQHIILDMVFGKVELFKGKRIGLGTEIYDRTSITLGKLDVFIGFFLLGCAWLIEVFI